MVRSRNNIGAQTEISYAPSTQLLLADERAGRPWVTRLPFPVQVVTRVEMFDLIGRVRAVSRYAYHHGYFDGPEREFRGFALVEQTDTEESRDDAFPAANFDAASWRPPVRTKTWFHVGAPSDGAISRQLASEYWIPPALRGPDATAARRALDLPDSTIPSGLSDVEYRETFRAMRGTVLRIEVYADDATARAENPYTVTEHSVEVRRLQALAGNPYAVFDVIPAESVTFNYERDLMTVRRQRSRLDSWSRRS